MENEALWISLIGVGGVVIGALVTFVLQLIINWQLFKHEKERIALEHTNEKENIELNNKLDKEKIKLEKKLEIYPKAFLYISKCCLSYTLSSNPSEQAKIEKECDELYNDFHPQLSLICNQDIINSFNDLRNDCASGRIRIDEAYPKVVGMFGDIAELK